MSETPSRRPVDTPAEWIRFATENFQVAEREMTYVKPAFHTVCFLCQSAAEKYVKGYLIAQGWSLEKTHDIVALLGWCIDYDDGFTDLLEGGAVLNEYIVTGRYPGDLVHETIERTEAEEAVEIVRRIKDIVEERMKLGEPEPNNITNDTTD